MREVGQLDFPTLAVFAKDPMGKIFKLISTVTYP